MSLRRFALAGIAFAALSFAAGPVWGLGFELGETKEQLKLQYEVEATDHGTGRVTVNLTLIDAGRLGPLRSVDLYVAPKDGTGYVDLSVRVEPRSEEDGKRVYSVHLSRELAERADFHLVTDHLDGKMSPLTWYYRRVPFADYLPAEKGKTE